MISDYPTLRPLLDEMSEISACLWEKGWAEGNAGNLSVDVTEYIAVDGKSLVGDQPLRLENAYPLLAERSFLLTGTGTRFREIARQPSHNLCLLRMTGDGGGYHMLECGDGESDFKPTSEFPSHLRIHEILRENKEPEKVVLHTHPSELITLTHLPGYRDEAVINRALWSMHPEVKYNLPKGVAFVPYALPGSETLAQATMTGFRRGYAVVLWEWHGCVAKAIEVAKAFDLIDIVNKAAKLLLMCRSVGHTPGGLSQEQLDELASFFGLME
jgi:rhamnulose-1-phosphate aldolase